MDKSFLDALNQVKQKSLNEVTITPAPRVAPAPPAGARPPSATPKAAPMGPDRPVGAVKTGGGNYNVYQKGSSTAQEFQSMYGAAKKAGAGTFEWQGRKYSTGQKGGEYSAPKPETEFPKPSEKQGPGVVSTTKDEPVARADKGQVAAVKQPENATPEQVGAARGIDIKSDQVVRGEKTVASSGLKATPRNLAVSIGGGPELSREREAASTSSTPPAPTPPARPQASDSTPPTPTPPQRPAAPAPEKKEEPPAPTFAFGAESGPEKKEKKKMSESLIDAFLKLQTSGAENMFEAAKKAKKDYDKDGKVESEKDEVWGSRMRAAKAAGKMEEGWKGESSGKDAAIKPAKTTDPDFAAPSANPDAPKSPIQYVPKKEEPKKTNEEVAFSEAELAHFEAVIARKDQKGKENALNPTVDSANLTDEYMDEMARGVKAGTKRGSYKKKATDLSGKRVVGADAAADDSDKGIPHVLDQIRSAKEDQKGHITLRDHNSDPAKPKTASVHRKVARDFYSDYHNTEKPADKNAKLAAFRSKVFGG